MDFTTEALAHAEQIVRDKRRKFIDFDEFMGESGKWERHDLVIGADRNAYDRCHYLSLCDHKHEPYPIHQIVFPYLKALTALQGAPEPRIEDDHLLERQAPLYFPGPRSGEFACIDVDAAYWSLYRVASLDLSYDGELTPRQGRIRFLGADELRPFKFPRNAVIGSIRAEVRTEAHYGEIRSVPIGPQWRRPGLWAWIIDTLEAIAWDARMLFGAVHIQVDGYIVPADVAGDLVRWLRSEWGLQASIRAVGPGTITGLGHWSIASTDKGSDAEEGFAEPHQAGMEHVDNMAQDKMSAARVNGLRSWFIDALAYKNETPKIKLLDGRELIW